MPGGDRRLIVSVCFYMYRAEEKKKKKKKEEILCQLDKHTHHLVTQLSKELASSSLLCLARFLFFVQGKQTLPY